MEEKLGGHYYLRESHTKSLYKWMALLKQYTAKYEKIPEIFVKGASFGGVELLEILGFFIIYKASRKSFVTQRQNGCSLRVP